MIFEREYIVYQKKLVDSIAIDVRDSSFRFVNKIIEDCTKVDEQFENYEKEFINQEKYC